jgi:hypothetical protein
MLKYRPKSFWGMLKPAQNSNLDIPTAAIAELNKKIFFDDTIQEEGYREIIDKAANYI